MFVDIPYMLAQNAGLQPLDGLVIVLYLIGITGLGIWVGRRLKGMDEFFMPRKFGKGMMIMHAFGTGTASDQAVSVASATFRNGLSGIWYQWLWLFVTPFYWLIAPIFRRFRAITTADVYELRYDRSVALLFSFVGIASMAIKIGVMLKGAGALIDSGTGGLVEPQLAIISITIMFVIYGVMGGLAAAIVTDYVQGILTVLFSFMLLPFILWEIGGVQGMKDSITDPAMLSLVAPGKISVFFIVMMSFQALMGIVAQPFIMGICGAGKTEWEGRVGIVGGNLIKRLCTAAWSVTAIAAVAWYIQSGTDLSALTAVALKQTADGIYGEVAYTFLPRLMPGLLGLFIAALLAGVMSSCDSFMISSAALFTENIYKPRRAGRTDQHYLWVGRIASILVVAGGVVFALWVSDMIKALEIWFMIAPMMGLVFWIGLLWRKMTVAGAWTTTITGFLTWWISTQSWFVGMVADVPYADSLRLLWIEGDTPVLYLPWQILLYSVTSAVMGIAVSLFTKPVSSEKLDRFYQLSRTPVQREETILQPCTLPTNSIVDRPMMTTFAGLEVPMPSRTSVAGFFTIWLIVAGMIGAFIWLINSQ